MPDPVFSRKQKLVFGFFIVWALVSLALAPVSVGLSLIVFGAFMIAASTAIAIEGWRNINKVFRKSEQ